VGKLASSAFPSHKWQLGKFIGTTRPRLALQVCVHEVFETYWTYSKLQKYARRIVRDIFPDVELLFNWRGETMKSSPVGLPLEIDIYLPSLKLGFEYQVFDLCEVCFKNAQICHIGIPPLLLQSLWKFNTSTVSRS
jgi:hypothetical protein